MCVTKKTNQPPPKMPAYDEKVVENNVKFDECHARLARLFGKDYQIISEQYTESSVYGGIMRIKIRNIFKGYEMKSLFVCWVTRDGQIGTVLEDDDS
jgi:hypothetical protein